MKERGRVHEACKWCYQGLWGILTPYFKLPKEPPYLPSVEGETIEYLHPSDAYLRYQKFKFWIGLFAIDVLLTLGWIALFIAWPLAGILITPLALAVIVLPDIVAYIAIHLNYDTTWYVLSDRSMRLRRGVWSLHETTITFDNIQNVHVQQGPLQRWFGFSNLHVQTAGGGGGEGHGAGTSGAHIGFLEGMSNAEEIRERILARCGRGAGLGEEANEPGASAIPLSGNRAFNAEQVELLRSIRDLTSRLAET